MILRGSENMLGFISTSNLNNMHYVMSERKLKELFSSWEKQEEKPIINCKKTECLVVSKRDQPNAQVTYWRHETQTDVEI